MTQINAVIGQLKVQMIEDNCCIIVSSQHPTRAHVSLSRIGPLKAPSGWHDLIVSLPIDIPTQRVHVEPSVTRLRVNTRPDFVRIFNYTEQLWLLIVYHHTGACSQLIHAIL